MRPVVRLSVLLLVTGCASAGTENSTSTSLTRAGMERPLIVNDQVVTTVNESRGVSGTVDASLDATWKALEAAYVGLGIKTETYDPKSGQIGNVNVRMMRRLNGVPLSTYFDCGSGFSGANADDHRLRVSIVSYMRPAAGGKTSVETAVQAFATNMEGTSRQEFACTTTGRLETRILEFVREHTR